MPIGVGIEDRDVDRERQQTVGELPVDDARIAFRHGERQVRIMHDAARRKIVLAAQAHTPAQVLA